MANKRIKDLSTTAAVTASDDFIAVDGATNGTRKLDAYSPTFGGNLTVSGTGGFGGSTGPHTFGNGGGAVEVRAVGDSSGYYGYALYTGGSYESSLKHSASTAITKLDVGRNSAWGGAFEIYADTTRAARFAKTSTTLDGNLTVSGGTISSGTASLTLKSTASTVLLQSAGTTALTLDSSQNATFACAVLCGAGFYIGWNGRSNMVSPSDGVITLRNAAGTAFNRLQFGGTTASFPALQYNTTDLKVVLADNSGLTGIEAKYHTSSGAPPTVSAGQISYGGTTATTVGAAGGASALPATPLGYIIVNVGGTSAKIPYYNA